MDFLPFQNIEYTQDTYIKVVGVGGGGCNAVNYLYNLGLKDVSFLVCNTDRQALLKMDVPAKLQLGEGLGAGGEPERAEKDALQSQEQIKDALSDGTRMVFITAGMGGGTGTGAAPIVAKIAQELDILTVGIVTIPFSFEGMQQIKKAMLGLSRLAQHTDALLVINNEKLKQIYPDLDLPNAFRKSDEVVSNAAKAIAEIITIPGYINTDFADVKNTLKGGNMAIMNVGVAEGEERVTKAIKNALHSPLVNTTDVRGASRILINFYCSTQHALLMQELDQVDRFRSAVGNNVTVKWGATYDDSLDEKVKVTLIATGYSVSDIPGLEDAIREAEAEQELKDNEPQTATIKTPSLGDAIKKLYDMDSVGADIPFEIQTAPDTEDQPTDSPDDADIEDLPATENDDSDTINIDDDTTAEKVDANIIESKGEKKKFSTERLNMLQDDVILIDDVSDADLEQLESIPAWQRKRK